VFYGCICSHVASGNADDLPLSLLSPVPLLLLLLLLLPHHHCWVLLRK